jgi:hypothetical protein
VHRPARARAQSPSRLRVPSCTQRDTSEGQGPARAPARHRESPTFGRAWPLAPLLACEACGFAAIDSGQRPPFVGGAWGNQERNHQLASGVDFHVHPRLPEAIFISQIGCLSHERSHATGEDQWAARLYSISLSSRVGPRPRKLPSVAQKCPPTAHPRRGKRARFE